MASVSSLGSLSLLLQWLAQHSRPFLVNGKKVSILYTPDAFFRALTEGILESKKRVILSSLYLGTGSREAELVDCFQKALSDTSRHDLKCTILLDHLRGSRGQPNSRTMVQKLVSHYGDRFSLGLYHTPNLRGIAKAIGPERFNEVMGLQHMKIYLFDNSVLLSGANLSRDYFVDRQDRYILFKDCKELADFFADVVNATLSHSFTLNQDGSTTVPSALPFNPLSSRRAAGAFKASLSKAIGQLTMPRQTPASVLTRESSSSELDTVVCPLIQMGFCGIRQDEIATEKLLSSVDGDDSLYLASGYFNLPPVYSNAILRAKGDYKIIAAAPQANGFYGAKGVAGHVPAMYVHFARRFLKDVVKTGNEGRVSYWEYVRPGWTFHGKGLWYYPGGHEWPSATLVGSSNYGHRSLTRDLEAQVAIVTRNSELRKALHKEKNLLFEHANELTLEQVSSDPARKLTMLEQIATTLLQPHV